MKNKVFILIIFLQLIFISLVNGQANFTVTPQLIELDLAPGTRRIIKILLVNESPKDSQRFKIFTSDVIETEKGNYKLVEKGTGTFSCVDWIRLDTMEIVLGPKKGKEIPFELRVPIRISGGWFCAIVFELQPRLTPMEEGYAGASVAYHFQIPAQIEVTIQSSLTPKPRNVEVTSIEIIPATEDKDYNRLLRKAAQNALVVRAMVNNRGNIHIKAKGDLIITDSKGKRLRKVPLGAGRGMVLPQTQVRFTSVIKRPLPGDYLAEAVINYGGLSPAKGRVPFTVTKRYSSIKGNLLSTTPIGLIVSREVLDMAVATTGYRTQVLTFSNQENEAIKVKINPKYLTFDENGTVVASDSGNVNFSCINWLNIEPREFEITPGQTKAVKIELNVKDALPGGRYACITCEALLATAKENSLPTSLQIPVIVTVIGKSEKKGEVTKVEVSKGNPPGFSVYFKNTGKIHLKPKIKIELKFIPKTPETSDLTYVGEPRSALVGVFGMGNFPVPVIPGCEAKFEQDYERMLESGNYMAVVTVEYGSSESAVFIHKFKVN
jgi:hypothetical protein